MREHSGNMRMCYYRATKGGEQLEDRPGGSQHCTPATTAYQAMAAVVVQTEASEKEAENWENYYTR